MLKKKIPMALVNIVVVGCGGTGGKVITELGRFLASFSASNVKCRLSLIDGDRVEAKNISRQPFSEMDIGVEKCLALQETLRECFSLETNAYPVYLDTAEQLDEIIRTNESALLKGYDYYTYDVKKVTVIVGAVDNHRARQVLEEVYQNSPNCYYIDSANEFDVGEVAYGLRLLGNELSYSRAFYYPEVLTDKGKRASELSCAAVNVSSPQHIVTNMLAANIVLSALIQFIQSGKPRTGITYFNALSGTSVHREASVSLEVEG